LAEAYPSVGIVGAYQLSGSKVVLWKGLPRNTEAIAGQEVCRWSFLNDVVVFGNPTSSLYRSDLIRRNRPFFPHLWPHADRSAAFKCLQHSDYGFVHEILSTERIHHDQVSTKANNLGMYYLAKVDTLLEYGPIYLTENEFEMLKNGTLKNYWKWLGACLLKLEGAELWRFQGARLKELGYPLSCRKILMGALDEIIDEMHNPKAALSKLLTVLKNKCHMKRMIS